MHCSTRIVLALAWALAAGAQDGERKPADYPVQVPVGGVILAAENLGPAVPSTLGSLYTNGYLTIEIAMFPDKARTTDVTHGQFTLRINGTKTQIPADSSGAVAASIKYPDWERRRHLEASAGMGDGVVIVGRPAPVGRFPGDPTTRRTPVPSTPTGLEREKDPATVEEIVARAGLPEGDLRLPVRGCLYFPYKGKLKKIKTLEVIYTGPLGEAVLRIP